jgi:cytochrome c-type biogenesis protein CcmH
VALVGLVTPVLAAGQPDLDAKVRALARQLRCPVCQNLSVADSSSELARDMRELIRAELKAGKTPEEVKAYFVSKYGEWILLSPRPRGLTLLLWLGPFAGALAGLAAALVAVRRWARRSGPAACPAPDPGLLAQVRQEALADETDADAADAEGRSPLEGERLSLYDALRELAFDHRAGKLSDADYAAMRAEYEARAAVVLGELSRIRSTPHPSPEKAGPRKDQPGPPRRPEAPVRHPWRLAAAGVFLLIFGVSVGYFLSQSIRPRASEQESITGDPLTGTAPARTTRAASPVAREVPTLLASGRSAYQQGQWTAAIDAFKEVLTVEPENPEAHTYLSLVLLQGGHADEALRAVDRALRTDPSLPLARWAKGLILFDGKQDYAGAIQVWEPLMGGEGEAYRAEKVNAARGEATRFRERLREYGRARAVTETRLYLEAVERVLARVKKFVVSPEIKEDSLDLWFLGEGTSLAQLPKLPPTEGSRP